MAPNRLVSHAADGVAPDKTYNTSNYKEKHFSHNQDKALEMETELFAKFKTDFAGLDQVDTSTITLADLQDTLKAFNEEQGLVGGVPNEAVEITNKIAILNAKLTQYGLGSIPIYSQTEAEAERKKNLLGLDPAQYERAILETGP